MKRYISTFEAPAAIGPYSQGIEAHNTLYISGQIPVCPKSNTIADNIEDQTAQCLENLKAIATEAGYSLEDIVKTSVLLDNMDNFDAMNTIYAKYFDSHKPARVCYQVVKLPKGVLVEIDAIAVK